MRRVLVWGVVGAAGCAVAAGLIAVGRATVSPPPDRYRAGYSAGYSAGDFAGTQAGHQEGLQEGRALQEGSQLPASAKQPAQQAFTAGYVAGANDAFGSFDGGWTTSAPYVITLTSGGTTSGNTTSGNSATSGINYRITERTKLQPGRSYYLCPDGRTLCQSPR